MHESRGHNNKGSIKDFNKTLRGKQRKAKRTQHLEALFPRS